MKGVILDYESLAPQDLNVDKLYKLPVEWTVYSHTTPEQVPDRIKGTQIVLTNKVPLRKKEILSSSQLKMISVLATGTDIIDLEVAKDSHVVVCNVSQYGTPSVVQHTWSLILALTTKIMPYHKEVLQGEWSESLHFCMSHFPVRELYGKTLGIIGSGTLGRGVGKIGDAFGMNVQYALLPNRPISKQNQDIQKIPFEELLSEADVLSIHCPLTPETRNLISKVELQKMKPHAILVNSSRGGIIHEQDLKDALVNNFIGGAATDVLTQEPPAKEHVLLHSDIPNFIITPHTAWIAKEARQRLVDQTIDNVHAFISGKSIRQVI
jgi:glycerate dehydrogenase